MDFASLIGYQTSTHFTPNEFIKCYYDLPNDHFNRIVNASLLFSDAGIGPKVLSINQ
jgi:hypothetical protein